MEIDKEDLKTLVLLLNKLVEKIDQPEKENTIKQISETKPKRKYTKRSTNEDTNEKLRNKNKFCSMPESTMHKSDVDIDKKLNRFPPSKRERQYSSINVVCRVCGRREDVNPSLVDSTERYKCNRCSRVAG